MKEIDTLEEDKRIALLASNIKFIKLDSSPKIDALKNLQSTYKKEALDAVGIPKYIFGVDPYEESCNMAKLTIFERVEKGWKLIFK